MHGMYIKKHEGGKSRFENIGKGGENGKRKSNLNFWKLESQTHKEIKQQLERERYINICTRGEHDCGGFEGYLASTLIP